MLEPNSCQKYLLLMIETLIDWMRMLPILAVILTFLFGVWKGISWLGGKKLQQLRKDYPYRFPAVMLSILVCTPFLIAAVITGEWKSTMRYAAMTFGGMATLLLFLRGAVQGV